MLLSPTSLLSSSSDNHDSPTQINSNSSRLTRGAKAAISLFSVISVLAIAAILILLFRRRRRHSRSASPRPLLIPRNNGPYLESNSDYGTPLATPTPSASSRSAPLTPPAKLSDRRYLQPALVKGAPGSLASPSTGNQTNTSPSVSATIQVSSSPQREQSAMVDNVQFPGSVIDTALPRHPQSSIYSLSSDPGVSSATIESNTVSSVHSGSATVTGSDTLRSSATKYPRVHDGPLFDSTVNATPAGPPPCGALPALPSTHPNSPTFPASSVSPRSPTFPARPMARDESLAVPIGQGRTTGIPTSISTKELRDLTESYERETRASWGSWSGVGGGGPGVVPVSRRRGSAEKKGESKTAVPLQELDLEKLSGRY
ncbi:hypothetical protein F4802DRAFT_551893 [Xylaria palmicola]|nr:hypothetical protein F4802DRAFT_551893 [Xylaria palmicola]